jgi:hypothetical protein
MSHGTVVLTLEYRSFCAAVRTMRQGVELIGAEVK